ncbi:MAG: hypothetical protein WCI90_06950 [Chlorobium sp.]|nr:MAG: hypothetical protein FDX17_10950 [Chlorobium sp.]
MKLSFEIEYYAHGLGGSLYTVRFEGAENTELDKFLSKKEIKESHDFEPLVSRLGDMVEHQGFKEWFFKPEGSIKDALSAFHYDNGPLRLFCLRWSSVLLIAGFGGIKTTRTYQEDSTLKDIADKLQIIDGLIEARQKSGEIVIDSRTGIISGNLNFTSN